MKTFWYICKQTNKMAKVRYWSTFGLRPQYPIEYFWFYNYFSKTFQCIKYDTNHQWGVFCYFLINFFKSHIWVYCKTCLKYETNHQWVVFFFLDSDFIVPNMKKITSHWWFVSYLAQWKSLVIRIIFRTMKISVYNFRSKHFIIVTVTYKHCQISYLLEKNSQCHKITHKSILTDFSSWILMTLKKWRRLQKRK